MTGNVPSCVDDLECLAAKTLDPSVWRYYESASDQELTLNRNSDVFKRLLIRPSVLSKSMKHIDTSVTLFDGTKLDSPIALSPVAFQKYAHPEGEVATAKACKNRKSVMILSGWSHTPLENVKTGSNANIWQNVVVFKDRSKTQALVKSAEDIGCKALVVTCNLGAVGNRRGTDYGTLPLRWANFTPEEEKLDEFHHGDPATTWPDIKALCRSSKLPVVVKGVITAKEAEQAVKSGAKAILVSNHGGRQLDSSAATVECIEEVVRAVGNKCDVFVDGGFRNGNDIFKALALGAKAVFLGRPITWGLAYNGQEGVEKVFDMLNNELRTTMALAGCQTIEEITADRIVRTCDCGAMISKL